LQQQLLGALFSYFCSPTTFVAKEVKVVVVLLTALVLDLLRNSSREFARYSKEFKPPVIVDNQDVEEYELKMQPQVFDRIQASVLDTSGEIGVLGDSLGEVPFQISPLF
jgi:hypothetical protein